jgi:hypothetical protein
MGPSDVGSMSNLTVTGEETELQSMLIGEKSRNCNWKWRNS